MLELHVADGDVTGGSISIGWCVSADTLKQLADAGVKKPALVIITAPADDMGDEDLDNCRYGTKKEYRKVVPLSDLVAYVEFRTAGKNNIWAFITDDVHKSRSKFLATSSYGPVCTVLNSRGTKWTEYRQNLTDNKDWSLCLDDYAKVGNLLSQPVSVLVPAECFAAEPAEWEKAWVNHFFRREVEDQCAFRKRRLFAYTVQPIIMFFNLLARFMFLLIGTLIGARGWTAEHVLHPLSSDISEADDLLRKGSYFVGRGKNRILNWARLPFMPVFIMLYILLWRMHAIVRAGEIVLMFTGLFGTIFGIVFLCFVVKDYRKEKEKATQAWYLNQEDLPLILCSTGNKATSLNQLPAAKRTLRLRFQDLKSKVCRPFSA